MFCQNCGTELHGENSCPKCGHPIVVNNQPTANPQTPPQMVPSAPFNQPAPAPKKKKKWWIAIIVVVAVFAVFWIIGILGGDGSTDTTADNSSSNTQSANVDSNGNNIGQYKVDLKEARTATDSADKSILIVTYTFTNNSDTAQAFVYAIDDTAYQNGVELGPVWTSYGIDGLDFDAKSKEIKPGVSLDVQCAYELNDETTDVEIELQRFASLSDEAELTYTITLN
mgnify:CR=1 FL=1